MKPIALPTGVPMSRRAFIQSTSITTAAATLSMKLPAVVAAGSEVLKVGLVGCGGRGTGAATQVLTASQTPVILWAMADLFRDRLDASYKQLAQGGKGRYDREDLGSLSSKMDVSEERKFNGFDAIHRLLESGIDMVILATPPAFRPSQFQAAVEAGKHVFMEKPVAVDPVGIRQVIATAEKAKQKGLSVVAGTQRRHQKHYIEMIQRIHDGAIGEIVGGECYWNAGATSVNAVKPSGMSEMEWQCRRWYPHCWLSGDHIVEQHVHNIDVMLWALGQHPVSALGVGGRQVRQGGNIWDHFTVEYEFANGLRIMSMCRQIEGCSDRVAERVVGTQGVAFFTSNDGRIEGHKPFKPDKSPNPYVEEHADWIRSIRDGKPLNEGLTVAESTLSAIMGRMSAYTGQMVSWEWAIKESKLSLLPPKLELGDLPPAPVPIPGKTPLI